jgi:hypothetical protein
MGRVVIRVPWTELLEQSTELVVVSPHNDRGRVRSLRKSLNFRSPVILSTFEDMVNTNIKIQISIGSCSSEDC